MRALAALLLLAACSGPGPRAIALGEESCAYCRMTISDARFGGEAVTRQGRVETFDSIDCLLGWARSAPKDAGSAMYVIDVQHPGTFVPADSAGFLVGAVIHPPMGRPVVAFRSPALAREQQVMLGGSVTTWAELLAAPAEVAHR